MTPSDPSVPDSGRGELLPCPFCGGPARQYHRSEGDGWSNTDSAAALSSRDAIIEGLRAELAKAISVKNRLQDNNSSMAEGWTAMLVRAEAAEARYAELTAALVRIALKDRHGRIVKPQEDGGFRGIGGMLAVFALTGKNGSFVLDKEIAAQYPAAFSALSAASSKEEERHV